MSTSAADDTAGRAPRSARRAPLGAVGLPLLTALVALAGSLWLSVGMGLKACPLCFYQRTFVMGVVAVLGVGVLAGERHRAVLNLLALPMALAGLAVAAFHVFLEQAGRLECPAGVAGAGTAPQQSLAVLAVLFALVVAGLAWSRGAADPFWPPLAGGVAAGLLLAWGAVASAPPAPPAPTKPYESALDTCRPPFRLP